MGSSFPFISLNKGCEANGGEVETYILTVTNNKTETSELKEGLSKAGLHKVFTVPQLSTEVERVDANFLEAQKVKMHTNYYVSYTSNKRRGVTSAEVAKSFSHYKLWKLFSKKPTQVFLVLESNVLVKPEILKKRMQYFANNPEKLHLLSHFPAESILQFLTNGIHGYLLSGETANKLAQAYKEHVMPLEDFLLASSYSREIFWMQDFAVNFQLKTVFKSNQLLVENECNDGLVRKIDTEKSDIVNNKNLQVYFSPKAQKYFLSIVYTEEKNDGLFIFQDLELFHDLYNFFKKTF